MFVFARTILRGPKGDKVSQRQIQDPCGGGVSGQVRSCLALQGVSEGKFDYKAITIAASSRPKLRLELRDCGVTESVISLRLRLRSPARPPGPLSRAHPCPAVQTPAGGAEFFSKDTLISGAPVTGGKTVRVTTARSWRPMVLSPRPRSSLPNITCWTART